MKFLTQRSQSIFSLGHFRTGGLNFVSPCNDVRNSEAVSRELSVIKCQDTCLSGSICGSSSLYITISISSHIFGLHKMSK